MNISPVDNLLSRLDQVQETPRGWKACCPSHDDHSPSLSISEGNDGRALLKCWAGCEAMDVVQSLGLTLADLFERDDTYKRPDNRQVIRPNWREIIQLAFHDCTVIALYADKIISGVTLNTDDLDCLNTSYRSLSAIISTTEALTMPKRKAA